MIYKTLHRKKHLIKKNTTTAAAETLFLQTGISGTKFLTTQKEKPTSKIKISPQIKQFESMTKSNETNKKLFIIVQR